MWDYTLQVKGGEAWRHIKTCNPFISCLDFYLYKPRRDLVPTHWKIREKYINRPLSRGGRRINLFLLAQPRSEKVENEVGRAKNLLFLYKMAWYHFITTKRMHFVFLSYLNFVITVWSPNLHEMTTPGRAWRNIARQNYIIPAVQSAFKLD